MASDDSLTWRLKTPQVSEGDAVLAAPTANEVELSQGPTMLSAAGSQTDAVSVALQLAAATLSYGPLSFDFRKIRSPDGGLVLTLTQERGSEAGERPVRLDRQEQIIPPARAHLPAGQRSHLEAEYLRVFGRGLFDDVAHLARLELGFA